jgi:hypothetical protein
VARGWGWEPRARVALQKVRFLIQAPSDLLLLLANARCISGSWFIGFYAIGSGNWHAPKNIGFRT